MTKRTQTFPVLLWATCYTLWLLFFAAGFWLMLRIRLVLLGLGRLASANHWILSAVDRYALLLLGVVWLVLALALEAYLRGGVQKGIFWSRARRTVLWMVGLLAFTTAAAFVLK